MRTHFDVYADAVAAAGVAFRAMRPSVEVFGDLGDTMQRLLDPRRGPEFLMRRMFMPHLRASYEDLDRAAEGADVLVSHPIAFAVPVAFDQPDNARRAERLGVGRVLPFQRVTMNALAGELQHVLAGPDYARKAAAAKPTLAAEHGASAACDALERLAAR